MECRPITSSCIASCPLKITIFSSRTKGLFSLIYRLKMDVTMADFVLVAYSQGLTSQLIRIATINWSYLRFATRLSFIEFRECVGFASLS
jgi:hypothetical protein